MARGALGPGDILCGVEALGLTSSSSASSFIEGVWKRGTMKQSARKLLRHFGRGRDDARPDAHASEPATREQVSSPVALPVSRYDKLGADEVLTRLSDLTPNDLVKLSHHERTHQNRTRVVAGIDALLGNEPWPGYDALDVDGVRFGLDGAARDRSIVVLAYERAHKNRAGVVLAAQQKPGRDS
jgi:hypothetical protein